MAIKLSAVKAREKTERRLRLAGQVIILRFPGIFGTDA
jgi:hypothetical protein